MSAMRSNQHFQRNAVSLGGNQDQTCSVLMVELFNIKSSWPIFWVSKNLNMRNQNFSYFSKFRPGGQFSWGNELPTLPLRHVGSLFTKIWKIARERRSPGIFYFIILQKWTLWGIIGPTATWPSARSQLVLSTRVLVFLVRGWVSRCRDKLEWRLSQKI